MFGSFSVRPPNNRGDIFRGLGKIKDRAGTRSVSPPSLLLPHLSPDRDLRSYRIYITLSRAESYYQRTLSLAGQVGDWRIVVEAQDQVGPFAGTRPSSRSHELTRDRNVAPRILSAHRERSHRGEGMEM